jgi:hypothetical protein
MRTLLSLLLAAAVALVAGPAGAQSFEGEAQLYEAAKKEQAFTWYTAHFDTDTAAAICAGFEKKYAGIKGNDIRTTAQAEEPRRADRRLQELQRPRRHVRRDGGRARADHL